MRTSKWKLRKQPRAAKNVNPLRLEILEPRMLLSGNALSDLLAAYPLAHADPKSLWGGGDISISPQAEIQSAGEDPIPAASSITLPSNSLNPLDTITYDTRADGMPILNSLPGAPGNIFLDFDGDVAADHTWDPFNTEGTGATFTVAEQAIIVEAWRQVADFYSMFDVNVTTIQPDVDNQATAWHVITPSYNNGGLAWGIYPNTTPGSMSDGNWSPFNVQEAIAHEIGHTFGCGHISKYDTLGNNIQEYAVFSDPLHGSIMGGCGGVVNKWSYWHATAWYNPGGASYLQDDMYGVQTYGYIAHLIDANAPTGYTGDGIRSDDWGGTIATAHAMDSTGSIQVSSGILERPTDADAYSFTSAGGRYLITVGRDFHNGPDLKLSIYNSSGALIAGEDADPRDQPYAMANDQYISLDLPADTYYAVVESHGNYDDLGKYVVRVDPLLAGSAWSVDGVGLTALPGYATYNSSTDAYTLAGSGYFIYPSTSSSIGGTADSFQFEYQTLQGDGQIIAKVSGLSSVDNPKAGIMIRDSLDSNAMSAALIFNSASPNKAYFYYRSSAGGSTSTSSLTAYTSYYLKLVRSGNSFSAWVSSTGSSWSQVGSTRTIAMGQTVYIGLASTANLNSWGHNTDPTGPQLNAATFTNVSLSATGTGVLNPTPTVDPGLAVPGALTVTGRTASSISLSWSNVSGETGYRVERSANGVQFTQVGTTAADVTTYTDSALIDPNTGLPLYQNYFYRVRAQSASGYSAPSAAVNTTPRAGPVSSLVVNSISASQLVLDWSDASGETGYRVERSPDGTSGWTAIHTVGTNVPSYTNSGLSAYTRYYYRVVTLDSSGDAGISDVASNFTRLADVTGLTFTTKESYQMAFQWNAVAGAASYRIERSTNGSSYTTLTSTWTQTNYTDNNVSPTHEYYYRVTALNAEIEGKAKTIFAASPAAAGLPTPWSTQDIGAVSSSGAAQYNNGVFTLIASGDEIWDSTDEFRYVYKSVSGDFSYTTQVTSVEDTSYWSKAGLMIRESTAVGARHAMIYISPHLAVFQWRSTANTNISDVYGPSVTAPYYVRITRSGNTYTGEISPNGSSDWTTVGSKTFTMNTTVLLGFALCSRNDDTLNTSTFTIPAEANTAPTVDAPAAAAPNPVTGTTAVLSARGADDHGEANLTYTWTATSKPTGAPNPTYSRNGTNAAQSTTVTFGLSGNYTFRVTMTDTGGLSVTSTVPVTVNDNIPAPWQSQDVGAVAAAGSAGYSAGTFTVIGSGADIWNTADEFRFVYIELTGDRTVIARVASVETTNSWAKAGVMIRDSLDAGSMQASTFITPGNGAVFQYRSSVGGSSYSGGSSSSITAPYWVKITRSGNSFTSFISATGTSWTQLGSAVTINMTGSVYVGLAVTSHNDGVLNTSTFDNVSVSNSAPTVATPAAASPDTVAGATTNLSVLGADDYGEANLTYTWTATTLPSGAAQPTYSVNGTNAAKNSIATFSQAGGYVLQVTITDGGGLTATSAVPVTVNQTLTSITVDPASVQLPPGGTRQFSATGFDQFGDPLSSLPTIAWSADEGEITPSGLYTASGTTTTDTVHATSGSISGTATVNVVNNPPTIVNSAA
ncbi:MAG: fibronectin type III domain-containing protein, partial [Pirellulales bacterium]|nr:fibronectin type III domain-containing protein [Pirellulales bacterium]